MKLPDIPTSELSPFLVIWKVPIVSFPEYVIDGKFLVANIKFHSE
ncbi:MAG: hypothetical protein ACTSUO_06575 [Candidatus Thorarchaeota archaeon]